MKPKEIFVSYNQLETILDKLDSVKEYKFQLLISYILGSGARPKELKKVKKADLLKFIEPRIYDRCKDYIEHFEGEYMFDFTDQHISQKLKLIRLEHANYLESLTAHDIRRAHFRREYEMAVSLTNLEKEAILRGIHKKIGYYKFKETLSYLGITMADIQPQ